MAETGHAANAAVFWEVVRAATETVRWMEGKMAGMSNSMESGRAEGEAGECDEGVEVVLWEHADDVGLLATAQNVVEAEL